MSSSENELVATAAFIEHHVVEFALEHDCSLKEASRSVGPKFGVRDDLIFPLWQTRFLGLLYCLLVFPSEIWKRDELLDVVVEAASKDRHLSEKARGMISRQLVRGIRNAAAHARIEFKEESIEFVDQRPSSDPHFRLSLSYREATNLVLVLGRAFHESGQVKAFLASAGRTQ